MRKTIFLSFVILVLILGGCDKKGEDKKTAIDPFALNGEWNILITVKEYRLGPPPLENAQTEEDGCDSININLDAYNAIKESLDANMNKPNPAKMYLELDAEGKGLVSLYSAEEEYDLLDEEDKEDATITVGYVFDGKTLKCSMSDDGYSVFVDADIAREDGKLTLSGSFVYEADKEDDFRVAGALSGEK